MANLTRTNSKNVAIGVTLLALAGSLLAVDVGTTRVVEPVQPSVVAEATPLSTPQAVAAPHRPSERATFTALIVRKVVRRGDDARRRPRARERIAASHFIARVAARAVSQPNVARKTIAVLAPVRIVARAAATPAPRATVRPAPPAANHPNAKRRAGRSAVEAAQYFAVRTVEAQTHGLEHVAAVTHKRGVSRLVVYIIARTHAGTLVEYEVLRRNGIGFAIESRTSRFVALSGRTKAAVRTSPAGHA